MAWEQSKLIFQYREERFLTDYNGTAEELMMSGLPSIHASVTKQTKSITEYEEQIDYYSNNDIHRYFTYSLFPGGMIDNTPLFNSFGQKLYNDYLIENNI